MPSRAFTVIGIGGFQPVASSFEMSAFSSGITSLAVAVAQHDHRRHLARRVRCRRGTRPDGDSCVVVIAVVRRERDVGPCRRGRCGRGGGSTGPAPSRGPSPRTRPCGVFSSTCAICVTGPSPVVIWFFSAPGREVVEVELAPVVALRVPDHLVGRPQHAPARARLEVRRLGLLEHRAHGAGRGVGHAERPPACGRATSRRRRAATPSGLHCMSLRLKLSPSIARW